MGTALSGDIYSVGPASSRQLHNVSSRERGNSVHALHCLGRTIHFPKPPGSTGASLRHRRTDFDACGFLSWCQRFCEVRQPCHGEQDWVMLTTRHLVVGTSCIRFIANPGVRASDPPAVLKLLQALAHAHECRLVSERASSFFRLNCATGPEIYCSAGVLKIFSASARWLVLSQKFYSGCGPFSVSATGRKALLRIPWLRWLHEANKWREFSPCQVWI